MAHLPIRPPNLNGQSECTYFLMKEWRYSGSVIDPTLLVNIPLLTDPVFSCFMYGKCLRGYQTTFLGLFTSFVVILMVKWLITA